MASLQKNVASQKITFAFVNATSGAALTGATAAGNKSVDGAAQASVGGSFSELGLGQYLFSPSQTDTNGTSIGYLFTATNAIPVNLHFFTDSVDASGLLKVDVEDWKGSAAAAMTGDAFARLGAPAGASVSVDVAAVKTDTAAVKVQTDKLTFTVANQVDANPLSINGDATGAANLAKTTRAICRGTCTTGGSTTSIPTSAFTPGGANVTGQFIGRTILFDANTTTVGLQGQASNITGSTSGATPTFTVTALTTAPANGDTFSIV